MYVSPLFFYQSLQKDDTLGWRWSGNSCGCPSVKQLLQRLPLARTRILAALECRDTVSVDE